MTDIAGEAATGRRAAAVDLLILGIAAALVVDLLSPGMAVIGGGGGLKLLFLGRTAALLMLATWLLRRRGRGWRDLGLRRPASWRAAAAIPAGLIAIGVVAGAIKALLVRTGHAVPDYSAFRPLRGNLGEYLFWMVPGSLGSAAFGEELVFRGFMLDAFRRLADGLRGSTDYAIVAQAAVFGLLHLYQGLGGIVTTAAVGLVLGIAWRATGRNLWAGIAIHGVLDGAAMTAIYYGVLPV